MKLNVLISIRIRYTEQQRTVDAVKSKIRAKNMIRNKMKRQILARSMPKLIRNILFVQNPDISKRTVGTQGLTINKNIETKKATNRVIREASTEKEDIEVMAEEEVITRINQEEEFISTTISELEHGPPKCLILK